jgi:acetyl esterase/lipase
MKFDLSASLTPSVLPAVILGVMFGMTFGISSLVSPLVRADDLVPQAFSVSEPASIWPGIPPGDENIQLGDEYDTSTAESPQQGGRPVMRLTNVTNPTLTIYTPNDDIRKDTAVIICPGGGHNILAYDLEGTEVAEWLASIGVTAAVLKYRVPSRTPENRATAAVQDAQRAVSILRSQAESLRISKSKIGVLGFSAGGETAAMTAYSVARTYKEVDGTDSVSCQPDFNVLIYPAYLINRETFELRSDLIISDKSPPAFLVHAIDDPVTADSSLQLTRSLMQSKVPAELHVFNDGGHGYGMRKTELPITNWPDLLQAWMTTRGLLD